MTGDSKTKT